MVGKQFGDSVPTRGQARNGYGKNRAPYVISQYVAVHHDIPAFSSTWVSSPYGSPKNMAITKWISFGANQQNPASPTNPAQGGLPLAVAVSSADTKEFGLENVCP